MTRLLSGLFLATLLAVSFSGCSRQGATTPGAGGDEAAPAAPAGVGAAAGAPGSSGGKAWAHVERQKDCDAEPVERFAASTLGVIRYLWQDCNGNGVEDTEGDTYTADYHDDGTVDRRVVRREAETTVEYYYDHGGRLPVYAWFVSEDRWHLTDFSYSQFSDQWKSEHHVGYFALQKLSRLNNQWYPFSESPFCFYDTDADGLPEVALRCCTLYEQGQDANDFSLIRTPLEGRPRPLLCGFRLSFDLENDACPQEPYSYSLSLTVELLDPVDETPYLRPFVTSYGRKLNFIPKDAALELARAILTGDVPARKRVGLAHEIHSSGRWEGVIWYQDGLHKVRNAGGPPTREDRLQDFEDCEPDAVRLYASRHDNLVHLLGADHSIVRQKYGDTIYGDSDGDGYADMVQQGGDVVHLGRDSFIDLSLEDLFEAVGAVRSRR
ncbi:MAG: hypothetical protein JW952_00680 [Candidatus Eisenbacteria bacterium]|nr:hypothetical protein [Candidatus Eisenbacteria bacterium]